MKFILFPIVSMIALLWFPNGSNAQYRVNDFEGRWRSSHTGRPHISGQPDTDENDFAGIVHANKIKSSKAKPSH